MAVTTQKNILLNLQEIKIKKQLLCLSEVEKKNHGHSVSVTTVWHIGACIFYYLKLNIQLYDIKLPSLLELKI